MEWYYGLDTEDLVVPTDQELLDMSPPPDSWPHWGMSGSQSFGWTMSFDPIKRTDLPDEKNQQKMVFGKANGQISLQESEHQNGFTIAGGWSKDPCCRNAMMHGHPDFQFNDLTRNDQMDDIFLSSLFKEDLPPHESNDDKPSCPPGTQFSSMPADGNLTDLMFDSESVSDVVQSTGSPQNSRTCVQSPSVDLETGHVSASSFSNSTSTGLNDHTVVKALESKVLPSYAKNSNGQNGNSGSVCVGGEISMEESVLHNLEVTLTQLPENARLCFRDSLYRLAHNSIQQMSGQDQVKVPAVDELPEREADDERIRSGETETAESETNTIDRAVANFMFKNVDVNTMDLVPAMSAAKHKPKAIEETKGSKYISFSPPEIYQYPPT